MNANMIWIVPALVGMGAALSWLGVAHAARVGGNGLLRFAAVALGCCHAGVACRSILAGISFIEVTPGGLILYAFTSGACMAAAVGVLGVLSNPYMQSISQPPVSAGVTQYEI